MNEIEDLISRGIVELKMFDTKPEHAKEYGLDSVNPLYVQSLCITENQRQKLLAGKYEVVIKSKLFKGILNYGELILKGREEKEILLSTYICHPSMANNELSGPLVSLCLINYFQKFKKLKKTLRFIFIPETIGSIAYLSKNLDYLKKYTVGGYNLSCIGDPIP